MAWSNRITLEYIQHSKAREAIESQLRALNATDVNIVKLVIETEGGYVWYEVQLGDGPCFRAWDDGTITIIKL